MSEKNEYEEKNPSGFKRIYPVKSETYEKLEGQAIKLFEEENRMKSSKGSPIKGSEQELMSQTKSQRSPSEGKKKSVIKKNNSCQEGNIILKKMPYS
jgi:hypothetical protein